MNSEYLKIRKKKKYEKITGNLYDDYMLLRYFKDIYSLNLAINDNVGLIVNSSRKILYSFTKYETFDLEVEQSTKKVQLKMEKILINKSIINA